MAFVIAHGSCGGCGKLIQFNPDKVPSLRDQSGVKQPICFVCVGKWEKLHGKKFQIPKDAYSILDDNAL